MRDLTCEEARFVAGGVPGTGSITIVGEGANPFVSIGFKGSALILTGIANAVGSNGTTVTTTVVGSINFGGANGTPG